MDFYQKHHQEGSPVRPPAPASAPPATFSRTYPATAGQIRSVRADVRALLHDSPVADDAVLCASELAANAAIHSGSRRPGGTLTITMHAHVRIEVRDDGGPWAQPATDIDRPHGLDIVQTLAAQWGVVDTASGRVVWAQLEWSDA
jgi:serine/threonine-protein kinase RsbW